jgi:putative transposase
MPYWQLYYHVVWATKHRLPLIADVMIEPIELAIAHTSRELEVIVHAVGIMPDHVHVFAQVPPSLSVARVIGRWKGASSHEANKLGANGDLRLAWQSGYGALSVSKSGFDRVLEYVQNQRERHAARQIYGAMERDEDD